MASFGIAQEDAAEWIGEPEEQLYFEVYEENWQSLLIFIGMSTQWHWTGGMDSRRSGLNYAALDAMMKFADVRKKDRMEIFQDVQEMERAALAEWHALIKKS